MECYSVQGPKHPRNKVELNSTLWINNASHRCTRTRGKQSVLLNCSIVDSAATSSNAYQIVQVLVCYEHASMK